MARIRTQKLADPQVGARLRYWRKLRGLTLAELSALSGVSVASLSKYEHNLQSPPYRVLWRLLWVMRTDPVTFWSTSPDSQGSAQG